MPYLLEQRRDLEEKRQRAVEEQLKSFEESLDKAKKRGREDVDDLAAEVRNLSVEEHGDFMGMD